MLFYNHKASFEKIKPIDERGVSIIVGAVLILLILVTIYTQYQIFGIPNMMKEYESRHFADVQADLINLVSSAKKAIADKKTESATVKIGSTYPTIPFFQTPSGFTGSLTVYESSVKILNARPVEDDVVIESTLTGKNIRYKPSYMFYDGGDAIIEYGVIAVGKREFYPLSGHIINGNTIYIPFFDGNLSESSNVAESYTLYPVSGGGRGVLIRDNGNPIKLCLATSLPASFWNRTIVNSNAYAVDNDPDCNGVAIVLPHGIYKLITGKVSFTPSKLEPSYLYRISPKQQTSPAELIVQVRDQFHNPLANSAVIFIPQNASTQLCVVVNVSGSWTYSCTSGQRTVYSNEEGYASVIAKTSGVDIIVARVTRYDGSPYETAFLLD